MKCADDLDGLQVGDLVRIKDGLVSYMDRSVVPYMLRYSGQTARVFNKSGSGSNYMTLLTEDKMCFNWHYTLFDRINECEMELNEISTADILALFEM